MGQKVNPNGLRIGINKDWEAKWIAGKKNFGNYILEDAQIRHFIKDVYKPVVAKAAEEVAEQSADAKPVRKLDDKPRISKIVIERCDQYIRVKVYTGRPGLMIGKEGSGTETIRREVAKICRANGHNPKSVLIEFVAIKSPDRDAQLVAEDIASQLERRVSFRRAMKMAMMRATKAGASGIKTMVSGRLDGAEIARTEQYHTGSIPLQTLRADIDYGFAEADTTYGKLGIKVWIYKGEIIAKKAVNKEGGEA
ncbi:MAG: 30S ribosomal protein S3 [Clostridia bacterium]|nr:30S ribosomal protein S3 [Clostridia bacterium]